MDDRCTPYDWPEQEPTEVPDDAPSPEEIDRMCKVIRSEWSDAEFRKRATIRPKPWEVNRSRLSFPQDA